MLFLQKKKIYTEQWYKETATAVSNHSKDMLLKHRYSVKIDLWEGAVSASLGLFSTT